jgi:hypothetical protein
MNLIILITTFILAIFASPAFAKDHKPPAPPPPPPSHSPEPRPICSDGDTACVNWGHAVGYCDKSEWWIREYCINGAMCSEEPYPVCWKKSN